MWSPSEITQGLFLNGRAWPRISLPSKMLACHSLTVSWSPPFPPPCPLFRLPITKSCPIHRATLKLTSPGPAEAKPQASHFGGLEPKWEGELCVNKWGDSVLNSGLQRVWGARAPWLPSAVHRITLLCRESLVRNRWAQNFSGSLPQHASLQSL